MNLDKLKNFPNQLIDGDPTECVALTVADICGNMDGVPYDPDFLYAYTLKLMGKEPNTSGLDPLTGMLTPVVYGLLPLSAADFSAKVMGELYVANYKNYSMDDRLLAQKFPRTGVKSLWSHQEIVDFINKTQTGVSMSIKWYGSFALCGSKGILPEPTGNFSYHNVAVYDGGPDGLMLKPWLGGGFGHGGYCYMSESIFNEVFQSAAGFVDSWRWFSLASIATTRPWVIPDILPLLYATH